MSLILEALRKSEAERRRGEVPDLLSQPMPMARPGRAGLPRGWLWMAVVLAVVLALPLTWLLRDAPVVPEAPVPAPAGTPVEAAEPGEPLAPVDTVPQTPPAPVAGPPVAEPPVHDATPAPGTATTPMAIPSPPRPEPQPVVALEPPSGSVPEPAPELASEPVRVAPEIVSGPAIEPAPVPAPMPDPAPASERPVSLAGLSGEERRQLPPLKVSMHMWSEDVARRFAIVDGRRVGEGDRIGDAVVTEITRDAVVLDWHGRRLEVPIR